MSNRLKDSPQRLASYRTPSRYLPYLRYAVNGTCLVLGTALGALIKQEWAAITDFMAHLDFNRLAQLSWFLLVIPALVALTLLSRAAIRFRRWQRENIHCGIHDAKRHWKAVKVATSKEQDSRVSGGYAYDIQTFGVGTLSTSWTRIPEFRGSVGEAFRKRLEENRDASWYLINMSPYSYKEESRTIYDLMQKAARRNTTIRWCYQVPDDVMRHPTLLHMWRWLYSHEPNLETRTALPTLCDTLGGLSRKVEVFIHDHRKGEMDENNTRWLVYHSTAPTFYLAWLCVPGQLEEHRGRSDAPEGTFGYVMPYAFFPTYEDRPGFYFDKGEKPPEASDEQWALQHTLLDYYFKSTVRFFEEGVKDGPFRYLYPIDARPAAMGSGYDVCAGGKQAQL